MPALSSRWIKLRVADLLQVAVSVTPGEHSERDPPRAWRHALKCTRSDGKVKLHRVQYLVKRPYSMLKEKIRALSGSEQAKRYRTP